MKTRFEGLGHSVEKNVRNAILGTPDGQISGSIVVIGVGGDDLPPASALQRRETKAMIKPRRSHLNREGEYWKSVLTALTSAEMILLLVAATIRQAGKRTLLFKAFKK